MKVERKGSHQDGPSGNQHKNRLKRVKVSSVMRQINIQSAITFHSKIFSDEETYLNVLTYARGKRGPSQCHKCPQMVWGGSRDHVEINAR